jgi:hypothetical protein
VATLSDLLIEQYGRDIRTRIVETEVTVTNSVTHLVSSNPMRIRLEVFNGSATNIWVAHDQTILPLPGGQRVNENIPMSIDWLESYYTPTYEWWAISSDAGHGVYVRETIIEAPE